MKQNNKTYLLAGIMFLFGVGLIYTSGAYKPISFLTFPPLFAFISYIVEDVVKDE